MDPTFAPSSSHTATINLPVTPSGLACTMEIYLTLDGTTKAATTGQVAFTSTGASQPVSGSIIMPSTAGTYMVFIDIVSGGVIIGAYQGSDNVTVAAATGPFTYGACSGVAHPVPSTVWDYPDLTFTINNPFSVPVTHTLTLWQVVVVSGQSSYYAQSNTTAGGVTLTAPGMASPLVLTIPANSSVTYRYTGVCSYAGVTYYNTEMNRNYPNYFFLQDELGNNSPEVGPLY